MRYLNRLLSKNLPLCTCNYPLYSAYNSLNHRVNFGQFKLCTDIEKNPGPSVHVDYLSTALKLGDIMYLILMLEICIITVIVKGHV